jgi:regulator of ribonuclease activity A
MCDLKYCQFQVLVVDGGGSMRRGMLGDNLATMALQNGWSGIIMYGCIRDSDDISRINVGVKALGTMPLKSIKKGEGDRDKPVKFGSVTFTPGQFAYADIDGIVVSPKELTLPPPKL